MGACGVPPKASGASGEASSSAEPQVAPAVRTRRAITGALREVGAVTVLLASLAQTAKVTPWPAALTIPQNRLFSALTGWSRMNARYPVLAPEPPAEDGVLVVDAQTRAGQPIDPLTGAAPSLEVPHFRLGVLWSDYTARIQKKSSADFEKSFRDYLAMRGGRVGAPETPDAQVVGLDAYWLVYESPAPGGTAVTVSGREKLFTHARGGKGSTSLPLVRPVLNR
jgi:hypothetical protein